MSDVPDTSEASGIRALGTRRIAVVYLSDGRRDDLTYVSIAALALAHRNQLDIHLVHAGFTGQPPESVRGSLALRGHSLLCHTLHPRPRASAGWNHITSTALAKIEAVDLISGAYRTVVYLDNDTLAVRPIDFFSVRPRNSALAAVCDTSVSTGLDNPRFFENCKKHGLTTRYFNSGCLVFDVEKWRRAGYSERFEESLAAHAECCPYNDGPCPDLDQCALNMALAGAWESLPLNLNAQKSVFQTKLWKEARIRHYTGAKKFLPIRPHCADAAEFALLAKIGADCPDLRLKVPSRLLGLAYWANVLRRTRDRRRITRHIVERLSPLVEAPS